MQRYFSKEAEAILNSAHGEKIDFGQHMPTTDRYMPMQDSPLEGMRVHRARGGAVRKHRAEGGDMAMREPEAAMRHGGHMKKHRAEGGEMEKERHGGPVRKHRAEGEALEKECHGGRVERKHGGHMGRGMEVEIMMEKPRTHHRKRCD